jgi:phospholipase C
MKMPPLRHSSKSQPSRSISRREFIRSAAFSTAGVAIGGLAVPKAYGAKRDKSLPKPHLSGVEHIIVVMMENRSFDHFLGWVPGADGRQMAMYPDDDGTMRPTMPLAPDYQGCGYTDPDHTYAGGRSEYNGGRCDGWLTTGNNDTYAIGYYTQADLPFYASAAAAWTTLDRYFSSIMAGTYPNRIYQHAAQTDRLENSLTISNLPTIWDRLAAHSLSARYYFSDVPLTALWGLKYLGITRHISEFFDDCEAGTLPQVSFVEPRFLGAAQGLSTDDHPHAHIHNGQIFLNSIYDAVTSSPNWPNTVLVINYDEWGGFFEHVPPPTAPVPPADLALGNDGLLGFRVPAMVISPWSRRGYVSHTTFEHTSVLKMIEWRWHLEPLTIRDRTATNLANALDFSRPNYNTPALAVPPPPMVTLCPIIPIPDKFALLAQLAARLGFTLPL